MRDKIKVHYERNPYMPQYDWRATFEDYEPGDPIGNGATEQEAIQDLLDQVEDP